MPRFSPLFLMLLAAPIDAHSAGTAKALNEMSGCGQGDATEQSKTFCANYYQLPQFQSDPLVKTATEKCLAFYEVALRIQNTMCSYSTDAVIFQMTAPSVKAAEIVGEANVSQMVASSDNQTVANINATYMSKLQELAAKLKTTYEDYSVGISKMFSAGCSDELYESLCSPSQVRGQVPGLLRRLLGSVSQATASVTYQSMYKASIDDYRNLRNVKEAADNNAGLTKMNAIQTGQVVKDVVDKPAAPKDPNEFVPLASGTDKFFTANGAQQALQMIAALAGKAKLVVAGGIIGGITTVVYKVSTGKPVKVSDTAIGIVASLGIPGFVASVGLNMLKNQAEATHENLLSYRNFAGDQLRANFNLSSIQLMDSWGQNKKIPGCQEAVAKEASCIQQRATMKPYEHNSCSLSPIMDSREPMGPNYRAGPLPPGY